MLTVSVEEIKDILEIALDKELDEFSMDAHFYFDMEMDSLAAVALVVEVQKRYGVRIPDERMPEVLNGNQLKAAIEDIAANPPAPADEAADVASPVAAPEQEKSEEPRV